MKKKVYNAGPLFNEAERKQRLYEGAKLREAGFDVFNPLEAMNAKETRLTSKTIFENDYAAICDADIFFFDLSNNDTGTMVELGIVTHMVETKNIQIYPIISDLRVDRAHEFEGFEIPIGWNKFTIGALRGSKIYSSFDDALEDAITSNQLK